ncbi:MULTISPECIES: hypothetical protein [Ramlibacter]|uniref:Uncharacterized protein n=1 Tax=Ramlibacter aquaticus TaxID=2780094 RepID=A0ABR9S9Q6_9BURK|nr:MULTISPECIES: hypothetical protein [Ramlibacter]MBE7939071.1 hypothetical protein [Ramlibacter aquaticus]
MELTSPNPATAPAPSCQAPRQWLRRQDEQVQMLTGPVGSYWVISVGVLEDSPGRRHYEGRVKICLNRPEDYFTATPVWRLAGTGESDSLMAAVERAERLGLLRVRAMLASPVPLPRRR